MVPTLDFQKHRFVFIAGLHRSGTSILFKCLREHPEISGFRDTGAIEDEGQLLQTVYPPASTYGGPGRFGFDPAASITEDSPLANEASGSRLFEEWGKYWDTSRPVLLEKSPPNLIRMRFLQRVFPNSHFVIVTRHPVAVSYATMRSDRISVLHRLLRHWLVCHRIASNDLKFLERVFVVRYERFVQEPEAHLNDIHRWIGVTSHRLSMPVKSDTNAKYFERWTAETRQLRTAPFLWAMRTCYEPGFRRFGYSIRELEFEGDSALRRP